MGLKDRLHDRGWWSFVFIKMAYVFVGIYLVGWSMPFLDSATTHVNGQSIGIIGRWMMTITGGALMIYALFFQKYKKLINAVDMICPNCQNPVLAALKPSNTKCLKCGVLLEPLKGFYQRHSELKKVKNQFPEDLMDDLK